MNPGTRKKQPPPIAELSSERTTPRKLNASPRDAHVRPRASPATLAFRNRATDASSKRDGASQRSGTTPRSKRLAESPRTRTAANGVRNQSDRVVNGAKRPVPKPKRTPRGDVNGTPGKSNGSIDDSANSPTSTKIASNPDASGVSSKATSVSGGSRKLNQMNGIVKHLNGVNETPSEVGSQSLAGESEVPSETKQAQKSKRKVPG